MTIKPSDLRIDPMGTITNSLGKAELEFVAALIIRWHQVNDHTEWQPVSRADIISLLTSDEAVQEWANNPFWKPDPHAFSRLGYITRWHEGPEAKGLLTEKFFAGLQKRLDADVKRAAQRETASSPDTP
jgi:hypothetical protein